MKITGIVETITYGGKKTKLEINFDLTDESVKQFIDWRGQKLTFDVAPPSLFGPLFEATGNSEDEDEEEADPGSYTINGERYPIRPALERLTGAELRVIADVPETTNLWRLVPHGDDDQVEQWCVSPLEVVALEDGMVFTTDPVDATVEEGTIPTEEPAAVDLELATTLAGERREVSADGRGAE